MGLLLLLHPHYIDILDIFICIFAFYLLVVPVSSQRLFERSINIQCNYRTLVQGNPIINVLG